VELKEFAMRKPKTFFKQIPVEIVKKIAKIDNPRIRSLLKTR